MKIRTPLRRYAQAAGLLALGLLAACDKPSAQPSTPLATTTVAQGLETPWGVAFLPDGRMLVTERPGRMRLVGTDGKLSAPLAGLPEVAARGQGGLLDVVLHPKFAENQLVYWSYSAPAPSGETGNSTAVARGRLDADALALRDVQVVFRQAPRVESIYHFGSRLVFTRDGNLFVTLGDRYSEDKDAQTLNNHHGKVVRITDDGGVPADNPYVGQTGKLPEIWSHGHRNVQGAALHPATGKLWTHEHGPQGGDELNVPQPGANHGWPVITYGRQYGTGLKIGEGTERADIAPALKTWVPSIAPSGMAFVTSDRYPAWKGQLLVGAMKAQQVVRLELDGERVTAEHRHDIGARVRDVRQAPDGWVYLLTDEGDKSRLLKVEAGG